MCRDRSRRWCLLVLVLAGGCTVDGAGVGVAEPVESTVEVVVDGGGLATSTEADGGVEAASAVVDAQPPDAGLSAADAGLTAGDAGEDPGVASIDALAPADAGEDDTGPAGLPDASLLLSLPLDEGQGAASVRDRSGLEQQVDLHRLNAARCWVEGRQGGALAFARSGYLQVAPRGAIAELTRFTLAAWVRRERGDDDGVLFSRGAPGLGGYGYRFWISDDRLRVQLNERGPRGGFDRTAAQALPVRRWVHVALTFDGQRVRLYQDGIASDEWSHEQPLAAIRADRPLLIGASESPDDSEGVRDRLTGWLDDVAVYGDALDPAQVAILAADQP